MNTQTGTTRQSLDALTSSSSEVIIQDKALRKDLIDTVIKIEGFLKEGKVNINHKFVSKPNPWGLIIETAMEQPRPDKPVIYKFRYMLDVVEYNKWIDEHKYMLGSEGALVFTSIRGIKIVITPQEPRRPTAHIVVEYGEYLSDKEHTVSLPLKSLNFIVHREVINMHDWIVKCVVD